MKISFKIDNGFSKEIIKDTKDENTIIKFDTDSVERMHNLSLDEAINKYSEQLENLTRKSSGRKKARR